MKNRTKQMAISGIFLALVMVVLFFATITPGIELTLIALAGVLVSLTIYETDLKIGCIFYIASVLLSLLIVPNKIMLLPYIFFFGLYGILKSIIEKQDNKVLQYILKILVFNILIGLGFLIFKEAFFEGIGLPDYSIYVLVICAQIFFLLYDKILTLFEIVYKQRFKR